MRMGSSLCGVDTGGFKDDASNNIGITVRTRSPVFKISLFVSVIFISNPHGCASISNAVREGIKGRSFGVAGHAFVVSFAIY